jgi:hypothetical protein
VEEVKVITKFWVNGESETAQAVSALPRRLANELLVVDRCRSSPALSAMINALEHDRSDDCSTVDFNRS